MQAVMHTWKDRLLRVLTTTLVWAPPIVLIVLPLAGFLAYSFFSLENGEIVHRFTLSNYIRFFRDAVFVPQFLRTCLLAAGVGVITLLVAYPVALLLWGLEGRAKHLMLVLFVIPLLMSYILKIFSIRAILGGRGYLNLLLMAAGVITEPTPFFLFNLTAVFLTLSIILFPFTLLPLFVTLERIPKSLIQASSDLGGASWLTFRRIVLPLSWPGGVIGASFTFVLALGDFVTPQMVGGPTGLTFGRIVYSQFGLAYNWPFGSALAVILMTAVLAVLALAARIGRMPGGQP